MGCFEDRIEKRDLNGAELRFDDCNSRDICLTACEKRGFPFASLQNGYQID